MVNATEKSMEEFGAQLEAEDKEQIETALNDVKELLAQEEIDSDALKEKTESLTQASMKLGEMAYRKAQEEAAGASSEAPETGDDEAGESASKDEDIVDAEFTEVDEDDKK
jgi:molecular chaperone DnaK